MPEVVGQVLSKQELIKKRDEYRAQATQLRFDAAANDGAAQAMQVLLDEMGTMEEQDEKKD